MRRNVAALLVLIILAAALAATAPAAPKNQPQAREQFQARIEMNYETFLVRLQLDKPASTIAYNLSGVPNPVLAAFIRTENGYVKGKVEGNRLVFSLPSPASSFNITVLFGGIYDIQGENITLKLPLLLSPIGYNTTVNGVLDVRASRVIYKKTPYGEVKGTSLVITNKTVAGGKSMVAQGSTKTYFIIMASISNLHRRIIIHRGWAEYRDNITVKLITDYPLEKLALRLPASYKVLGVEANLGPYPRRYITVSKRGDLQLVLISLLAAPQKRGQKSSIVLRLRTNQTGSLDAYIGYGVYVENYTAEICVEGTASITPSPLRTYRAGPYTCYVLPKPGPLVLDNYYQPVQVQARVEERQNIPWPLIVLVAALIALTGGYAYYASRRGPAQQALRNVEEEKMSEIEELLARREELYHTLVERLRDMRDKKVGTTKMIRAIREALNRDQRYASRIKSIASTLGEPGQRLITEMDRLTRELRSLFNRLERIEKSFKAGRIDKAEYTKQVEEIEREIEEKATQLAGLIRLLEY